MASTSTTQRDADAELSMAQVAQPPGPTSGAAVPEVPLGSADADQAALPDIFNLEWQREGMPDTEFNRKYPPDAWGEEAAPNARVWKVYRDYQTISDQGMLASWNKTLDVLIIFAGLFSAVLTAFLIESYKTLQPDYAQYVAAFLYAATVSHDRTGTLFPGLDAIGAPDRFIQTSDTQRWTNGLWFSSLTISLAVALFCILIKQWLDAYESHISSATSSPKYWAQRHCLYNRGLRTWGVPGLISFLPLLLHLSLFLFFVGLILFLRPLDGAISYSILVMVSCIAAFYILSLILPAWIIECPSYTPLLAQALLAYARAISALIHFCRLPNQLCYTASRVLTHTRETISKWIATLASFRRRRAQRLADTQPAVSRALSALSYIRGLPTKLLLIRRARPRSMVASFNAIAKNTVQRLESISLRNRQHLSRETHAISMYNLQLDGFVLSTLLNLPSDTNRDVIHTACVAIGAVTSACTTETIARAVTCDAFHRKIGDSFKELNSIQSGYGITVHAQLHRAYQALAVSNYPSVWHWLSYPPEAPGLRSSLGIDGLLLQAMDVDDADREPFEIELLFRSLRSLFVAGERSHIRPLRSTCLLFLDHHSKSPLSAPLFLPCFLLVFCAGDFISGDMHEFVHALKCVGMVLGKTCSITLPVHDGGDLDSACAVINGLWTMLMDPIRYQIDVGVAKLIAGHAGRCYRHILGDSNASWAQLPGLWALVRSPIFPSYVGTRDDLDQCMSLFCCANLDDSGEQQVGEFWECIATLMKISCHYKPRPDAAFTLSTDFMLFPVTAFDWEWIKRSAQRGPAITRDDYYEQPLSAFLDGPNAVASWEDDSSTDHDVWWALNLARLAYRISVVLCRRQHLRLPNDAFRRGFFAGSFLLARFRYIALREHIPREEGGECRFAELAFDLATHCRRLSPADFTDICTQLEQGGKEGDELRARAVAFAQRMREGTMFGGALPAECSPECPCMVTSARAVGSGRKLWDDLLARFRPSRNASVTSDNV